MSGSTTSAAPAAPPIQTANHFSLSGQGIHVDYSTTSFTGQPRLTYHDPARTLSFVGDDIRVVDVPDIGSIVSVTLNLSVDVGSTTFSVLIPHVTVSGIGGSAHIATDGITTMHRMPFAPQAFLGQREVYHVTHLTGQADFIVA
jgi:hypothetical protein